MDLNKFAKAFDCYIVLGRISDNDFHRHYAVQIIFSLEEDVKVVSSHKVYTGNVLAIKPLVDHKLNSFDQKVLIFLINPASKMGHAINRHFLNNNIEIFENKWSAKIQKLGHQWNQHKIGDQEFLQKFHSLSDSHFSDCDTRQHKADPRIIEALEVLEKNADDILSLESIAKAVALSPSRFIHLFKKETGITYRRMQIWLRILFAFDKISEHTNLTDLAIASGFSDSAHYSRAFKETFGTKPSFFIKNSQFIQV